MARKPWDAMTQADKNAMFREDIQTLAAEISGLHRDVARLRVELNQTKAELDEARRRTAPPTAGG